MELPAGFWAKTRSEDRGYETPCLIWTGYIKPNGYGQCAVNRRTKHAHRVAYEATHGPIPERINGERAVIDHKCRVRSCVNVDHLEVVTNRVNVLRGDTIQAANAAKTHCKRGHEFTPENTYIETRGNRKCRTCMQAANEAWNVKRRQEYVPKPRQTHCKRGHEFIPENTYVGAKGHRTCRTCKRDQARAARDLKRRS